MFRSQFLLHLLLVVASVVILGRPAPAGAGEALEADDRALLAVRTAALRRDEAGMLAHAREVDPAHPLAAYPEFWRLQMLLDDRHDIADPEALDAQVAHFIETHPGTVTARRLLAPWLRQLGRRSEWPLFETWFARGNPAPADSLWCLAGIARLEKGQDPGPEALRAWRERRELGEDCERFTLDAHAAGHLGTAALEQRLRRALELRATDTIRVLGRLLGIEADALSLAIESPVRTLAFASDPHATLIALGLLARPSPDEAARLLAARDDIPATDRELLWAIIGASAGRDLDPRAWQWARQGLNADSGRDTREWLVRAALLAEDWAGVLTALDHLDPADAMTPRWTYWRARALAATGAGDAARALFTLMAGQDGYYPMLAAEEIGRAGRQPAPGAEPDPPVAPEKIAGRPAIRRALALYRLGLPGDAQLEWLAGLGSASDAELLAAARLACTRELFDRCVNDASRMRQHDDWSLRYLAPFRGPLEAAARTQDLDPAWVYGLIRQESRFAPAARSGAGARGLMQIMPATGQWIARRRGIRGFRTTLLDEPATNLEYGTWYLRHVLDRLEGSILLASAAYNAGPGRPPRWLSSIGRPIEGALFAELIPFNETRNYAQNVIANTAAYGAVLRGESLQLKKLLGQVRPEPAAEPDGDPAAGESAAAPRGRTGPAARSG